MKSWNSSQSRVETLDVLSGTLVDSRNSKSFSWNSRFLEFDSRVLDKNALSVLFIYMSFFLMNVLLAGRCDFHVSFARGICKGTFEIDI